ncbi:DNA replication protein [Haloplanus ruber]|uniref:DNA replication protein n=1 Tax=Haloplanus ruber TaxID=869892 RepID=A0ABD6D1K5_9EURY|nr:DNA replication protein [Haloplanus ruber]
MNVEELRTVQRTERQKDSLQHLRDSFYRDVADYIAERKAEREQIAAAADDPFSSPEVSRLTDEIETAEEVVESIYERRIGKIVKRATFAAAGMATEDEGLTTEERDLFDDLVARIEANRDTVLDTLSGESPADAEDADPDATEESTPPTASDDRPSGDAGDAPADAADRSPTSPDPIRSGDDGAPPDPDDILAEAMGGDDSSPATANGGDAGSTDADPTSSPPGPAPDPDAPARDDSPAPDGGETGTERTTLRITSDVGAIFGVDEREYDLASEDVVTLPTPNAEPLLERDAAERLE